MKIVLLFFVNVVFALQAVSVIKKNVTFPKHQLVLNYFYELTVKGSLINNVETFTQKSDPEKIEIVHAVTNTFVYLFFVPYPLGPQNSGGTNTKMIPTDDNWLYAGKAVTNDKGDFQIYGWSNVENVNARLQPTLVIQMDDKYCKVEVDKNGQIINGNIGDNQYNTDECDKVKPN